MVHHQDMTSSMVTVLLWAGVLGLAVPAKAGFEDARQFTGLRLGQPAPDFLLPGTSERLAGVCARQSVLLVFGPADDTPAAEVARSIAAVESKLRARHARTVFVDSASESIRRTYLRSGRAGATASIVFLIDHARILRRVLAVPAPATVGANLLEMISTYEAGKLGFESACVRCHGDDGDDDGYPNIKKLRGIGNRQTQSEITEHLHPLTLSPDQISVRTFIFTRTNLDALVLYVLGL
jgi:cytochrome c553